MKSIVFLLPLLIILNEHRAYGQDNSARLENMNNKAVPMLASGTIITLVSTTVFAIGVKKLKTGVVYQHDCIMCGTYAVDNRPRGAAFTTAGAVSLIGGAVLLGFGSKFKHYYNIERKKLKVTTGYLKSGNLGVELQF